MNGIGIRITELRKQAGMSQFQLAKVLDIATSTLGMYETGKREPSLKVLNRIASYFNVSTDYLLGRPEKKTGTTKSDKIEDMLDSAMTFDGKPLSNNDRNVIRGMIEAYLKNKE